MITPTPPLGQHVITYCSPPAFCTAVLLSKSIFVSIWPILQYHHLSVPSPILIFASFISCSVPLRHFTLLLLYFRRTNHKKWIRSALAKTLFSWCVGPFPGKCTPRPLPPSGGHWRYHAVHHQPPHHKKCSRPPSVIHSKPKRPHLQSQTPLKSFPTTTGKRPIDSHMLPQSLTPQTALNALMDIAHHPLPKRHCRR